MTRNPAVPVGAFVASFGDLWFDLGVVERELNENIDLLLYAVWKEHTTGEILLRTDFRDCMRRFHTMRKTGTQLNPASDSASGNQIWVEPFREIVIFGSRRKTGMTYLHFYQIQDARTEVSYQEELTPHGDLFSHLERYAQMMNGLQTRTSIRESVPMEHVLPSASYGLYATGWLENPPTDLFRFYVHQEETETERETIMSAPMSIEGVRYELPGGKAYISRKLGGFENDVLGLKELAEQGKHVLLLGEPGVGKTALFQAAFPESENEIGHSRLTAFDMLWRPRPLEDGTIVFDPSPLTRAAMEGKPFYFDEIMRANEDALTPLYSAMDGRGFIVGGNLDGTDLPVKPGFVVIAASNPLVRGAFLPDAIASRFHILDVQVSESLLAELGLNDRLITLWNNLSNREGGDSWVPSVRELLAAQDFIDRGNWHQAAYALTGWRVPARDRKMVAEVVGPLFGARVGELGGVIA